MRRQAVQLLGAMGARPELWAMYQSATEPESKKAVLQALGVAGDSDRLLEVARSDKDPDMRIAAMRLLGPFGGPTKGAAIVEIYKVVERRAPARGGAVGALRLERRARAHRDRA